MVDIPVNLPDKKIEIKDEEELYPDEKPSTVIESSATVKELSKIDKDAIYKRSIYSDIDFAISMLQDLKEAREIYQKIKEDKKFFDEVLTK